MIVGGLIVFKEAVIKQARFFCLFDLRILMPRHGNSKSFPAVSVRGVWQKTICRRSSLRLLMPLTGN